MRKKGRKSLCIALMCLTVLSACSNNQTDSSTEVASEAVASTQATDTQENMQQDILAVLDEAVTFDEYDTVVEWSEEDANLITLNGSNATVSGSGAVMEEGSLIITEPGTYVLSGTLDDGQIMVEVKDTEVVRLVLNGVELHSSDSAPIYVKEADKVVLTLEKGTENTVTDGEDYVFSDASTDEPSAAIFSKADLTINGEGSLTVQGNFNDGMTSKDRLKVVGGSIQISAVDDGMIGKDMIAVRDGEITIESGGDGMKASNDSDASKGFVAMEGGTFHITSVKDGIVAETSFVASGGSYTVISGGGSSDAQTAGSSTNEASTDSMKAIKASGDIMIAGGTFELNAADDALHSNSNLTITGGSIDMTSGDDGIHADSSIVITGGSIHIARSHEGIEAARIDISDGDIYIQASDDGINVAGGNDEDQRGESVAEDEFNSSESNQLTISGGQVTVDASGDGLDANGSIYMTGGTVVIHGPVLRDNGALDYDDTFEISGGMLVAAGSSGMVVAPSEESSQYTVIMNYSEPHPAGTLVHLEDGEGNAIVTFAPMKDYQSVVISSPKLTDGAYVLYSGGTVDGSETDGLYVDGTYQGGTEVLQFEISQSVTWLTETGVSDGSSAILGTPTAPTGRSMEGENGQEGAGNRAEGMEDRNLEGMQERPEGMESSPEGLQEKPEGMEGSPEGLQEKPEGMESSPEGMEERPEGMGNRPEGVAPDGRLPGEVAPDGSATEESSEGSVQ